MRKLVFIVKFLIFFLYNICIRVGLCSGRECIILAPDSNPLWVRLLKPKPAPFASRFR